METTFLSDSILVQAGTFSDYVLLFGIVFWTILAFSGIWIWKRTHVRKLGFLFTLISFLPFSYLCYQSYEEKDGFIYQLEINKKRNQIRFGDSKEPDIIFPIEEFISYQIKSESESKKDGILYTDTIYLHHQSGLLLPVADVSVKRYNDNKEGFSRYSLVSREFKKFFRILPLPVEKETGKPFKEILVKPELPAKNENPKLSKLENAELLPDSQNLNQPPNKIEAPQFPLEWKHQIINANWYFSFSLLAIGHLGVLLLCANFHEDRNNNRLLGVLILLFGYLSFGSQYYFWILPKSNTQYKIESKANGFQFYSSENKNITLEGEWIFHSDKIAYLELPKKTLHIQTKMAYEKAMTLVESLESDSPDLSNALKLTKEAYNASEWVRWDLSDLPMEVAVRLFLVL
ncbi:hypothetical protein EHQ68_10560 [Leptospira congkakensis]|uniref:Uncharacterized protein n=1 Tax=Leptospira congkakensis TaxID=2484932 RepID=A0A4Z1A9L8_9LEPT|nr:hypothetical protein [Leptospira congkakensis]TGL88257.1 hypothetical protein EHQ68_10560 [Leptospira congkakensis]TGL95362.1 hypothetical protein EHQ69_02745 [Leptospira congkakensis]TGL96443.1 hypothetical protein EHQ70_09795 [Leptospira congkakensis]